MRPGVHLQRLQASSTPAPPGVLGFNCLVHTVTASTDCFKSQTRHGEHSPYSTLSCRCGAPSLGHASCHGLPAVLDFLDGAADWTVWKGTYHGGSAHFSHTVLHHLCVLCTSLSILSTWSYLIFQIFTIFWAWKALPPHLPGQPSRRPLLTNSLHEAFHDLLSEDQLPSSLHTLGTCCQASLPLLGTQSTEDSASCVSFSSLPHQIAAPPEWGPCLCVFLLDGAQNRPLKWREFIISHGHFWVTHGSGPWSERQQAVQQGSRAPLASRGS